MNDPDVNIRRFVKHRRGTQMRLQQVNRALERWAEIDAQAEVPPELRRPVEPPTLGRQALRELRAMILDVIAEQEAAWERRQ